MRYQIKEALDRVSTITNIHPNRLRVSRTEPGRIQVQCVDESANEHDFKYSGGEVLMWDKIERNWIQVPSGYHC